MLDASSWKCDDLSTSHLLKWQVQCRWSILQRTNSIDDPCPSRSVWIVVEVCNLASCSSKHRTLPNTHKALKECQIGQHAALCLVEKKPSQSVDCQAIAQEQLEKPFFLGELLKPGQADLATHESCQEKGAGNMPVGRWSPRTLTTQMYGPYWKWGYSSQLCYQTVIDIIKINYINAGKYTIHAWILYGFGVVFLALQKKAFSYLEITKREEISPPKGHDLNVT